MKDLLLCWNNRRKDDTEMDLLRKNFKRPSHVGCYGFARKVQNALSAALFNSTLHADVELVGALLPAGLKSTVSPFARSGLNL